MATFRVRNIINLIGNYYYVIQKKYWLGWFDYLKFDNPKDRDKIAQQLKDQGNIVLYL